MDTTDRKKSYLWLLIIILIAFISGGTGYLMARYQLQTQIENLNNQLNSLQSQMTQLNKNSNTLNNSTSSETDETADWETYTNSTYGFSFKYPKSYSIQNSSGSTDIVSIYSPSNTNVEDVDNAQLVAYLNVLGSGTESETMTRHFLSHKFESGYLNISFDKTDENYQEMLSSFQFTN